eukprot:TRINITY_DN21952_c0_g2_i1.p1 TRINITY_DN21952_c0_g2~~TRINITY_DN21952_c0_g2_i1.p1  ORF type:complete len:537 (+),score=85.59 TRINITY_DN21952_c0_g2_i1:76-1686(+)
MAATSDRNLEDMKNLVVSALEENGVLGEIRAQLRANVYKAIECEDDQVNMEPNNSAASKLMKSPNGRLMSEIVAEFFDFYDLRHTLSVFVPESSIGRERRSRAEVAFDAGLMRVVSDSSILEQLISLATDTETQKGGISSASSTTASSPPPGASATHSSGFASQRTTATEGFGGKSDGGTPPDRMHFNQSERSRAGGAGAATAVTSAIRDGLGQTVGLGKDSGAGGNGGDDDSAVAEDSLLDEASSNAGSAIASGGGRERRKPLGKLPSLSGGSGKDHLAPLGVGSPSGSSAGGLGPVGGPEEVSLAESAAGISKDSLEEVREDMLRLQQIDQQIARLNRSASGAHNTSTTSVASRDRDGEGASGKIPLPEVSAEHSEDPVNVSRSHSEVSAGSGGIVRSPPRSASRSPGGSPVASASPAESPAQSAASSASLHRSTAAGGAKSAGGSFSKSADIEAVSAGDEHSISIEDSLGSGSIDLTGGDAHRSSLRRSPAADSHSAEEGVDEVEEELIDEDMSGGSSIEGYQSDANSSADRL